MTSFTQVTGLSYVLMSNDGKILSSAGWQDICKNFHRVHQETLVHCNRSDQYLSEHIHDGNFTCYFCANGLFDYAAPIIIDGEHVATVFTGQFFHEEPDEDYFRKQARKYSFDEETYIEALRKVPVISKENAQLMINFINQLVQNLADEGFTCKQLMDSQEELSDAKETLEDLVQQRTCQLEASREELQIVTASMTDLIYQIDLQGKILLISGPCLKILGYEVHEMVGKRFYEYLNDADKQEMLAIIQNGFNTDEEIELEIGLRRKDGNSIWVELFLRPSIDHQGTVRGMIVGARDICRRKKVEEELKTSLAEKDVLLREIHHRVKNNLQVISSLLGLQSKYIVDQRDLEIFKNSQDRVQSMAFVHEKLYQSADLVHINFGSYLYELSDFLSQAYGTNKAVRVKIECKDIYLAVDVAIPCGLIINELVTNAYKYAFSNSQNGNIFIRIGKDEIAPDEKYCLQVSDDGKGLPPDIDWKQTSSLGLRLVTMLSKQIKGEVQVDTQGGTSFRISFPVGK
jgi:PAS domain S-box-containing protein